MLGLTGGRTTSYEFVLFCIILCFNLHGGLPYFKYVESNVDSQLSNNIGWGEHGERKREREREKVREREGGSERERRHLWNWSLDFPLN